jgi:hypothetical protein
MGKYCAFLDTDNTFYRCTSMFEVSGYNVNELSMDEAYRRMARDNGCLACRMSLGCQINYLFSSLNPITLSTLALRALQKYKY